MAQYKLVRKVRDWLLECLLSNLNSALIIKGINFTTKDALLTKATITKLKHLALH